MSAITVDPVQAQCECSGRLWLSSGQSDWTRKAAQLPFTPDYTAWLTALCFTLANALLLTVRIRVENAALGYASRNTLAR